MVFGLIRLSQKTASGSKTAVLHAVCKVCVCVCVCVMPFAVLRSVCVCVCVCVCAWSNRTHL